MSHIPNKSHKAAVKEFFDHNATSWQDRYSKTDFESVSYRDRMAAALELLALHGQSCRLILDAGCGAGLQSVALRDKGFDVVSCDIAPAMARSTADVLCEADKSRTARVFVADLERSPLRDEVFDGVMMLGVIGYANQPGEVLNAISRALRPDGLLVISIAGERLLFGCICDILSRVPDAIYMRAKSILTGRGATVTNEDPGFYKRNYRYQNASEFDAMVAGHGFDILASRAVNFGRTHFMGKHLLPERMDILLSRVVSRLANIRLMRFLKEYARIYVVCARKKPN